MQTTMCFVAIPVPDNIKEAIEKEKQAIISQFPDDFGYTAFNWVKKENLHLTLLFLGDIKTESLPAIIEKIKETANGVGDRPLEIKINKICYGLKDKDMPRLIWLETEPNEALNNLHTKIANGLNSFYKIPSRGFVSHITLARTKAWQFKKINPEELPEIDKPLDLSFTAATIDLMQSKLSRLGPNYTILQTIKI